MYAKFVGGGGGEDCDMLEIIQNLIGLLKKSLAMSCQLNIYSLFRSTEDSCWRCAVSFVTSDWSVLI